MIPATLQQLEVVGRKASRLEQQVTAHISTLKAARQERSESEALADDLRRRLAAAEERHAAAVGQHERAEATLRHAATDYSKAQLLQKRLTNTLKDLQGFNRAVVVTEGGEVHHLHRSSNNTNGNVEDTAATMSNSRSGSNAVNASHYYPAGGASSSGASPSSSDVPYLRIADACTVHAPTLRKTVVVDAIVRSGGGALGGAEAAAAAATSSGNTSTIGGAGGGAAAATMAALLVPSMVSDALAGYNVCCTAVGPKGAGKSTAMWGALRNGGPLPPSAASASFNISPQNSALRSSGAVSDPSGFLLARHYKGFDDYHGAGTAPSSVCPAAVAPLFIHHLFSHFGTYDVTHFNIRMTFVELTPEGTTDLLLAPGAAASSSAYGGGGSISAAAAMMPIGFFNASSGGLEEGGGGEGAQLAKEHRQALLLRTATSVQIRSEADFYDTMRHAMHTRDYALAARDRAHQNSNTQNYHNPPRPSASSSSLPPSPLVAVADRLGGHLALTLSIENFNSRGNFRRSTVLFCDVAGGITTSSSPPPPPASASSASTSQQTPEQQWAARGAWALTDVISMASAAVSSAVSRAAAAEQQQQQSTIGAAAAAASAFPSAAAAEAAHRALGAVPLPHASNRLVQLVGEVFGGNAKGVMLCVLPPAAHMRASAEEAAAAASGSVEAAATSAIPPLLAASVNALAYAHYFKSTCHNAVPFDIPPELQQLTREAEGEEGEAAEAEGYPSEGYAEQYPDGAGGYGPHAHYPNTYQAGGQQQHHGYIHPRHQQYY